MLKEMIVVTSGALAVKTLEKRILYINSDVKSNCEQWKMKQKARQWYIFLIHEKESVWHLEEGKSRHLKKIRVIIIRVGNGEQIAAFRRGNKAITD